jgi:hypothetical protein
LTTGYLFRRASTASGPRSDTVGNDAKGAVMTTLWCATCGGVKDFEAVPDAHETERTCVGCGAAVLVGDLEPAAMAGYAAVA